VSTSLEIGLNGLTVTSFKGDAGGGGGGPPPYTPAMDFSIAANSQYVALIIDEL